MKFPRFLIVFGIAALVIALIFSAMLFRPIDAHKIPNEKVVAGDAIVTNIWITPSRLDNLRENNIKYLLVDIGGINEDGELSSSFTEFESFVNSIRKYELANDYDFILLPYSEIMTDKINISSPVFERGMIRIHKNLITMGFDGAFIDYEPVKPEQREYFLGFLDKLRSELPNNSILMVYSGALLFIESDEWGWDYLFMKNVAKRVDIISFPGYDTGITDEEEYKRHIEDQLKKVKLFYGRDSKFFFGVPTHKASPEIPKNALEVYNSVTNSSNTNPFLGIAIFAEWTMSDEEWGIIKEMRNG